MGTNGRIRIALAILAALALIAATVVAAREAAVPAETAVACSGECATCPGAEACGTADANEGMNSPCATVAHSCFCCGRCVKAAPDAFRINPQTGKAEVIPGAEADAIARGAAACPIGAIKH